MKCTICGAEVAENEKVCTACGAPVAAPVAPAPKEVKLLGPWGYFGLKILFSIPLVGFILLIVFSLDNKHLNRRNFARLGSALWWQSFCLLPASSRKSPI